MKKVFEVLKGFFVRIKEFFYLLFNSVRSHPLMFVCFFLLFLFLSFFLFGCQGLINVNDSPSAVVSAREFDIL